MFWNTSKDNTVDLVIGDYYSAFKNMRVTTAEGYRCDPLQSSEVLYLGSCDINGPLDDPEAVWSKLIHTQQGLRCPYIALSRINTGADAMVRRLTGYCEQFGPPKKLYAVLPRASGIEVPIKGTLVSIGAHSLFIDYLLKIDRIDEAEHKTLLKAVEFFKTQQDSAEYHLYKFEQSSAMLRMICERYGIELRWTPNISATGNDYFNRWMPLFLREVPWMASTCMGTGQLIDFAQEDDNSIGVKTQSSVAAVLQGEKQPVEAILAQLNANQQYLINSMPDQYQKMLWNTNR